jgi:hypothetical protein
LPARKIRVDVVDGSGNRYTVTFAGNVTRDKAVRLLEIVELLGGMPSANQEENQNHPGLTKIDRIRLVVHFPIVWFSSKDVQSMYERGLKEPISLSTVATYLSRFADRGVLMKSGGSSNLRYRIMTEAMQSTLNLAKNNK